MTYLPQTIITANPVTYYLVSIIGIHKKSVTIQKIRSSSLHMLYNAAYDPIIIEEIIRM